VRDSVKKTSGLKKRGSPGKERKKKKEGEATTATGEGEMFVRLGEKKE